MPDISPNSHHVLYDDSDPKKWQGDPDVAITGSGFSVPRGLEAVFSYNGLVMNDLTVYDKYRVMSIDGLADPDIRDLREDKPGDDGEDAFGSLYSGRTISMKVRVEAYSLEKLRDMEEALRTAFVNMTEQPLYFLTGDPEKDHYINCRKNASLTKEEDVSTMNFRHWRDWQITLRASDPRFYRSKGKYLTTLADIGGQPELNLSSGFEWASAINGWTLSNSSGVTSSGIAGDWFKTGSKSLKLRSNLSSTNSKQWNKTFTGIKAGTSYTISGDFRQLNEASTGFVHSDFYMIMYFLDANDNPLYYYASPPRTQSGQDDVEFSTSVTGVAPTNATKLMVGIRVDFNRPYTLWADNISVRYTNDYYNTKQAQIINVGNYNTEPKIILTGGMSDIKLYNQNAPEPFNNIKFKTGVTIADGNYYVIDIKNRTIVDKDGVNKMGNIDKTSGWLKLYPGHNIIYFDEDTNFTTSNAQFTFNWKDAWI